MIRPHHYPVIDAIGSGKHYTRDIALATGIPLPALWWKLCELRKAGIVQVTNGRPQGHGRPPKEYRLNVWTARP